LYLYSIWFLISSLWKQVSDLSYNVCSIFNKEIVRQVGKQDYIVLRRAFNNTLKNT